MAKVTILDIIMCKGRLGERGTFKDKLAKKIARWVASVLMREPDIRREFAIAMKIELQKLEKDMVPR